MCIRDSLGIVLAVIALCGTGVFGASLTHLTGTSRLWGDPEQISFSTPNPTLLKSLQDNTAVTAITEGVGAGYVSCLLYTSVAGLGLLPRLQSELVVEHGAQLLRGVHVELVPGQLLHPARQRGGRDLQLVTDLGELGPVDPDAGDFHFRQDLSLIHI